MENEGAEAGTQVIISLSTDTQLCLSLSTKDGSF